MKDLDLSKLSSEERRRALDELLAIEKQEKTQRKEAFEAIRMQFVHDVKTRFYEYVQHGKDFAAWIRQEAKGYYNVLVDYGKLKRTEQLGFTVGDETFRMKVKGAHVKGFDERADIAEKRLVDFLNNWIAQKADGKKNPMYKLAMAMVQRNEMGDLDYKSISHLYELESDFADP